MIRTPLNKRPEGTLVLTRTFENWSAGTAIEFIEYCDLDKKKQPTAVLGRIKGEQLVVPLNSVVERRIRSGRS